MLRLIDRARPRLPKYRHHKASGQAVVTLGRRDVYLGPWKSRASRTEYDRVIGEWIAAGRPSHVLRPNDAALTVVELIAAYWRFAKANYVKADGKTPTSEINGMKTAMRFLKQGYGHTRVAEFGPLALKAIQARMIEAGHARGTINQNISRIKRCFKWGVSEQLFPVTVFQALLTVDGLRRGKTRAKEGTGVKPIADAAVQATLPHLPEVVADMVRLQRLTGARPAEVCILRPCDVATDGEPWIFRPYAHKTQHHGQERTVFLGPKAQDVLRPYLLREKENYCFVPAESEQKRRAEAHERRVTPAGYGNNIGTNRRRKPKRKAGGRFTVASYRRAIARACEIAFDMPANLRKFPKDASPEQKAELRKQAKAWRAKYVWAPNQLRHTAATEIRKQFGLEAAKTVLGHSDVAMTQVYAEVDMQRAAAVMAEVG